MDSHQLRITSSAELPHELNPSQTVKIQTELEIYSVEKRDEQNGDFSFIYKGKISSYIDLQQWGKVFRGKGRLSESKLSRNAIYALQDKVEKLDVPEEVFYREMQTAFRRHLEEFYQRYQKEFNFI